ncbi:hypothetical protein SAMD00024442_10_31 [Candidatus Symbiothrix dinenymphae]|nr:hypothetical protein SAMD00024442_10_31 [Candidatus Symbiothrix dinenymphae]
MKKLFSFFSIAVLLLGSMPVAAQQPFGGGAGTAADPYKISDVAHLVLLDDSAVAGQTAGRYYRLTRNLINPSDTVTFSIGSGTAPFEGYFDGGGYKVNVKITDAESASGADYAGLFAAVDNAVIHDLGVTGSINVVSFMSIHVGGVCAEVVNDSHIYNCYSEVSIRVEAPDAIYAGGICGWMQMRDTITNCFNKANIIATSAGGNVYAAGICGVAAGDGYVTSCYNTGDITAHTEQPSVSVAAGIAMDGVTVKYCFAANANITQDGLLGGRITVDGVAVDSCFALATMRLNGIAMSSIDHTSKHGMDVSATTVTSPNFIYNTLRWNNTVWCTTRPVSLNRGYPLLFNMKFNVLYEPNGGNGSPFTEVLAYDDALTWHRFGPPTADKAFLGWAESPTGTGKQYADGAPFTGDRDVALYAKWGAKPSVFSFAFREDPMQPGGKFTALNMTTNTPVSAGGTVLPSNRVRFTIVPNDGYEVSGCAINGTSVGTIATDTIFVVNENTVVVVSFRMKTYTVKHYSELGVTPADGTYTVNTPYSFPVIASTSTDTFLGWYNNMDLTATRMNDGLLGSGDKEYWAKWARKLPFTEDFETSTDNVLAGWLFANNSGLNSWHIGAGASFGNVGNGAYITKNRDANYGYDASSATVVHLFCNLDVVGGDTLLVSFDWKGQGVPGQDYMDVYFINSATTVPRSASMLPVADRVGSYGGSNDWHHETLLFRVDNQYKDRLVFTWRNGGVSGLEGVPPIAIDNVMVNRPVDIKVTYNTDGGSSIPDAVLRQGMAVSRPTDPAKSGYVFSEWIVDDSNGISYSFDAPLLHDTTLTARWLPRAYSIAYELNGGSFPDTHRERYNIEDSPIDLTTPVPVKPSYSFAGWQNAAGVPVTGIPTGSSGDTVLYAQWAPKPEPITYVWNHGRPIVGLPNQPATYMPDATTPIYPAEHDTYPDSIYFVGWYGNEGMTDTLITSLPTGALGPKTLYAKWARIATVNVLRDDNRVDPVLVTKVETFESRPYDSIGYWTFENGNQPNFWLVGTATKRSGDNSAYISTGDEYLNEYDRTKASVVHLYRDYILPARHDTVWKSYHHYVLVNDGSGMQTQSGRDTMQLRVGTTYTLSFDWKGYGETTKDRLEVFMVDTGAIKSNPIAGSPLVEATGVHLLGTYNQSTGWKHERIILPHFTDTVRSRFVFSWKNDNSNGNQTPMALDNIRVDVSDDMTVLFDPVPLGTTDSRFDNLNRAKLDTVIEGCVVALANLPQNPATPGYIFNGWYDENGVVFDPTAPVFRNISLRAKWTPIRYNISYELGGGTNPVDAPYFYTTDAALPLRTGSNFAFEPVREGYTFVGWTDTIPTHSTVAITSIRRFSLGDTVLRATWQPIPYLIRYTDGTTPFAEMNYVVSTSAQSLLIPPPKPNYRFDGWVDNPELLGPAVTLLPPGSIGNKQYWARWIAQLFNETFDTDASMGEWYFENDGQTNYDHWVIDAGTSANKSARSAYISDDEQKTYHYNSNNGRKVHLWRMVGFESSRDTTFTLAFDWKCVGYTPPGEFTERDYFDVFLLDEDKPKPVVGTELTPANGVVRLGRYNGQLNWTNEVVIIPKTAENSTKTLVFTWKNAGLGGSSQPVAIDNVSVGRSKNVTLILDTLPNEPHYRVVESLEGQVILKPSDPQRDGYTFGGWFVGEDEDEAVQYDFAKPLLRTATLTARWDPRTCVILYHMDGGHFAKVSDSIVNFKPTDELTLRNPVRTDGYAFVGWYTAPRNGVNPRPLSTIRRGTTKDLDLYAWWAKTYNIHFELNQGNPLRDTIYTIDSRFKLPLAVRPGYLFSNWYERDDQSQVDSVVGVKLAALGQLEDKTYRAKWTPVEYPITYRLNGGTNPVDSFKVYTIEAEAELKKPTRSGYSFAGWYTNADVTGSELKVIPVGSMGAVTVWAKWNTIPYDLTYVCAPGENPTQNPTFYTTDHDTRLEKATRVGYTFMGWHYDAALTQLISPDLVTIPQGTVGNRVLYAKWELTRYPITYMLDGGSFSAPNDRINSFLCDRDTILKAPVRQGFNFMGWYNSPNMEGARWDTIKRNSWCAPLTIYAKWQRALRVLFDSQGGNLFDPIEGLSAGNKIPMPLENPVRMDEETGKYYYFGGWFKEKECVTPWYFDTDVVTGNTRLYAWWVVFKDEFEADSDELFFGLDEGWINKSAGQTNKWYIGEATKAGGNQSAYISSNDRDNVYTARDPERNEYPLGGSIVHLYRDIVFGTSTRGAYTLSFDWKGMGETSNDYMQVFLTDVSVEPRAGRAISSWALGKGMYNGKHEWQHETIALGNYFGTTQRLIFTWINDKNGGQDPPIAIDNVIIVASELDFEVGPALSGSEGSEGSTDVAVVATTGVQIYPNPAKDVVIIRNATGNTVSIYNERGNMVFEKVIASKEEKLSITSWSPGVYLVRVAEKENLISTLKLIKE